MSSFLKKLAEVLAEAQARGVVSPETSKTLLDVGGEQDSRRHFVGLTSILGWLGGAVVVTGIILLISANWQHVGGLVKIAGFLVLLAAAHGGAFYIRWKKLPYPFTASALNFIGAGLFLAGVGLIAQVYNLHDRPANGVLMWVVAIVPLAVLLESGPITVMSIGAVLAWMHMEGATAGSVVAMPDTASCHILLEIGLGVGLVGFAGLARKVRLPVAATLRVCGFILVAALLYFYGFYRHWSYDYCSHYSNWHDAPTKLGMLLPFAALAVGALGLALGWRGMATASLTLRAALLALLAAVLIIAGGGAAVDTGILPRGPEVKAWEFGWWHGYDVAQWTIAIAAWLVWLTLSAWCLV